MSKVDVDSDDEKDIEISNELVGDLINPEEKVKKNSRDLEDDDNEAGDSGSDSDFSAISEIDSVMSEIESNQKPARGTFWTNEQEELLKTEIKASRKVFNGDELSKIFPDKSLDQLKRKFNQLKDSVRIPPMPIGWTKAVVNNAAQPVPPKPVVKPVQPIRPLKQIVWTLEEDQLLHQKVAELKDTPQMWTVIANLLGNRTAVDCVERWAKTRKLGIFNKTDDKPAETTANSAQSNKNGTSSANNTEVDEDWSKEEDELLRTLALKHIGAYNMWALVLAGFKGRNPLTSKDVHSLARRWTTLKAQKPNTMNTMQALGQRPVVQSLHTLVNQYKSIQSNQKTYQNAIDNVDSYGYEWTLEQDSLLLKEIERLRGRHDMWSETVKSFPALTINQIALRWSKLQANIAGRKGGVTGLGSRSGVITNNVSVANSAPSNPNANSSSSDAPIATPGSGKKRGRKPGSINTDAKVKANANESSEKPRRGRPSKNQTPNQTNSDRKTENDKEDNEDDDKSIEHNESKSKEKRSNSLQKAVEQRHMVTNEVLRIYPSQRHASEFMEIPPAYISNCCTGRIEHAAGFKWSYYTGEKIDNWDAMESKFKTNEELLQIQSEVSTGRRGRKPSKRRLSEGDENNEGDEESESDHPPAVKRQRRESNDKYVNYAGKGNPWSDKENTLLCDMVQYAMAGNKDGNYRVWQSIGVILRRKPKQCVLQYERLTKSKIGTSGSKAHESESDDSDEASESSGDINEETQNHDEEILKNKDNEVENGNNSDEGDLLSDTVDET